MNIPPKIYDAARRVSVSMRAENCTNAVPDYNAVKEYDDVLAIADWIKGNYTPPPVVKLSLIAEMIVDIVKSALKDLSISEIENILEPQLSYSQTEFRDTLWELLSKEVLYLTKDRKITGSIKCVN